LLARRRRGSPRRRRGAGVRLYTPVTMAVQGRWQDDQHGMGPAGVRMGPVAKTTTNETSRREGSGRTAGPGGPASRGPG